MENELSHLWNAMQNLFVLYNFILGLLLAVLYLSLLSVFKVVVIVLAFVVMSLFCVFSDHKIGLVIALTACH